MFKIRECYSWESSITLGPLSTDQPVSPQELVDLGVLKWGNQ